MITRPLESSNPWTLLSKVFLGAVEIAKLERGKFLFENFDHPPDTHSFASSHGLEIEVRINIEVSHLDEVKVRLPDQPYQSFHFFLPVREPWEDEEIHRGVNPFFFGLDQGTHHFPQRIPLGSVIPFVKLHAGTIERNTNAVEPRYAKLCQPLWKTPIGIEVDRPPIRFFSKEKDGLLQKPPLGQRFSFAPLTETEDPILCLLQMGQGDTQDLIDIRNKPNPLL